MTIQDAFMNNPHIQRVFHDEKFEGATVHPSNAALAARGIISALVIATVILRENRPVTYVPPGLLDEIRKAAP